MSEVFSTLKENTNSNTNQVEVYFCDAGFTPLYKSNLNKNSFYLFYEDFSINDISNINIKVKISKKQKIRIWSSHSNIHEYLNFLYICYQCPDNNISVIFTDDYKKSLYSIGAAKYTEIPTLLKYEIHLTKEEIEMYSNKWLELTKINSELRLFKNGKVINVNYYYLNKYILKYYNETKDIKSLIGKLMGLDEENNLSYDVYKYLVDRLFLK